MLLSINIYPVGLWISGLKKNKMLDDCLNSLLSEYLAVLLRPNNIRAHLWIFK